MGTRRCEEVRLEPTQKSPEINQLLSSLMGKDREQTIREGNCMTCDATNVTFRDKLSIKEYTISEMCQTCQDSVFGPD